MRYDTPIYFQTVKTQYNPDTGNHDVKVVSEVRRYASVTDTGAEMKNIIYGNLKQESKTIRLQNGYEEPFDRIRIGRKVYHVDWVRGLRVKFSMVVSEIPGGVANA